MSEQAGYSMLIEWSNLDGAYIVSLPEWEGAGHLAHTHGATYVEAAQKGQELLEFLIRGAQEAGEPLPEPALFDAHAYAPGETAEGVARDTQELLYELEMMEDTSNTRAGTGS